MARRRGPWKRKPASHEEHDDPFLGGSGPRSASLLDKQKGVQGSQYTSLAFGNRCREAGVRPSMGSVGDAFDNAMCEHSQGANALNEGSGSVVEGGHVRFAATKPPAVVRSTSGVQTGALSGLTSTVI